MGAGYLASLVYLYLVIERLCSTNIIGNNIKRTNTYGYIKIIMPVFSAEKSRN